MQTPLPAESARTAAVAPATAGLGVLIFVSITFGLAFGVYETLLPLYWDSRGMSFATMSWIFSLSAIGLFFLRVYVGRLSDVFGRKIFYTGSLVLAAASNLATPLLPTVLMQGVLKTAREASVLVRDAMHSVLLYEQDAARYTGALGLTRGAEFACHGLGSLAGGILAVIGAGAAAAAFVDFRTPFVVSGLLIAAGTFAFVALYRPALLPAPAGPRGQPLGLRTLFSIDLPPKLWLLVAFGFIFETGLRTTHCFIMQIYFGRLLADGMGYGPARTILGISVIMLLHRLTSGLPMMIVGPRLRRNLKAIFVGFVFFEGVALAVTPLFANAWAAIAVWLTHDLLGAGIWSPIHSSYIQQYSRPERRGADVSEVLGLAQLGQILGPLLAGFLLQALPVGPFGLGGPFIVGGAIVALSALILLKL